jgi:DNA helicase-2/ATP-dependent DNA helicase PcrA
MANDVNSIKTRYNRYTPMDNYKLEYDRLNESQKQAVDAIEGPVLVVAGPGTGKTQLLSVRVANILKSTDVSPDNVLCLTFTNKAALNMRTRLGKQIGSDGQRVMIKTFHGFSAEIMNLYPDYFWNGARLTNVPEAVQLEIITDILSELPLDNPLALKFAGQYTATKDVLEALKLTKEAGLTPTKLKSIIGYNIGYIDEIEADLVEICAERLSAKKLDTLAASVHNLPTHNTDINMRPLIALSTVIAESFDTAHGFDVDTSKTKHVSKWKSRWISSVDGVKGMHDERRRNAWWLAVAGVYDKYRSVLHQRGFYDYADMIVEVITQLEKNPDMRAAIQERFSYVLIDEFQDTNAAQMRLAHLVADHYVHEGNPNIMAVGDDDQSIYKFNGAELSNMLDFARSYPKAKTVVLTDNYRSSQAILDLSAHIIEQATERVVTVHPNLAKKLVAKNAPKKPGSIEHVSYPTSEHQYEAIAKEIADLKKNSPGSIAVLARGHDSLRAMAKALRRHNVPVRYEQQKDILEFEIVQQVQHITKIITAISDGNIAVVNEHMAQLLTHPVWNIPPATLWKLALENKKTKDWLGSLIDAKEQTLQNIGHWLLWLSTTAQNEPLPRMLEYIVGLSASEHLTSPLKEYFLSPQQVDTPFIAGLSAIRKLVELAQEFCKQGNASVADFVRLMQVNRDNNKVVSDESLYVTALDAVELLTVHKAKGLEYDNVFIIDALDKVWSPKNKGRLPPANLPLRPSGATIDDYIRLMFVAITRAKQSVYISSFAHTIDGEEVLPSLIVNEILPAREETFVLDDEALYILESAMQWPRLEGSQEKLLLQESLENYVLSPTGLLNFLDVSRGGPQYFMERHLLHLPEAQSVAAAFGSAMHSSLETAQQLARDNAFSLPKVLTAFETSLSEQQLLQKDQDRYLDHGQKILRQLFDDYKLTLSPTARPEIKLECAVDKVRMSGKLDNIDAGTGQKQVIITDYKTGKALTSLTTKAKNQQIKAWRHRTQLQAYILLAQNSGLYPNAEEFVAQMMYVEAETPKELTQTHQASPEELERLTKLISAVWKRITSLNLPDVRHYEANYHGIEQFENDLINDTI